MGLASSFIRSAVRSLPSKKPEGIMSKDKITGKIPVAKQTDEIISTDIPTDNLELPAARQTDELLSKETIDEATASRDKIRKFYNTPKNLRQKQKPQLKEAAQLLYDEKITKSEWDEIADRFYPPQIITEMPDFPHINRVAATLNEDQVEKGIIGKTLESSALAGKRVASRLDISAYDRFKTWVVSLHDGTKRGGPAIGYGQTAKLKNVEFISSEKGALNIARGRTDKTTIARIYGDWVDETPQDVYDFAARELNNPDSEWVQIGMNPYKHSYFYDKRTMEPVLTADEVIQVGPLVLAKNVLRGKASDFSFNKGGIMYGQQMNMFQEGGITLKDEGGKIEEVSGNKVPLGSTKEEVADDQDAKLSAGEMVLSADVVRYHGVEKIMALRDEAKIGYAKMDAMGQLGNAEEATIPTESIFNAGGPPFSIVDLEYVEADDDVDIDEMDSDVIEAQTGALVPLQQPDASFSRINPATGLPETSAAPESTVPQVLTPGAPAPIVTGSALTPTTLSTLTPTGTQTTPQTQLPTPAPLPTALQFLGGAQTTNFFINEIGQVIQIPVVNGRQIYPTPEGFQSYDPSNPQPFDPSLERATVTQPEQRQRPTRTVTETGGQPDVGLEGSDTPEGLGLGSLDAVDNASTEIGALDKDATVSKVQSILDKYDVNMTDVVSHGKLDPKNPQTYISPVFSLFADTVTKAQRERAQSKFEDAVENTRNTKGLAAATREAMQAIGVVGEDVEGPAGDAGLSGTGPGGFGVGKDEGGGLAGPGGDQSDTSESGLAGSQDESDFGDDSFGGMAVAEGGLISPRVHRKRMNKTNRKGLAARK